MRSPAIELRVVSKAFGAHRVINGLDLSVPARSIFGFFGNNGEGKSTTIRLITGLLRADAVAISVLGMDVAHERRRSLRRLA